MNRKVLYSILGLSLLIGIIVWQFFGMSSDQKKNTSLNVTNSSSGADSLEDTHQEETMIPLTSSQIEDLGIETKIAGPGELSVNISTRGKIVLHPDKLSHILAKISGVVVEARKNLGDQVKKDEVLAVLQSREMADIKANYLAAKEKKGLAFSLVDRERRLHEKKVSAEQDYINAKSVYAEAKINFQLAKQKLYAFGIDEDEINALSTKMDPDLKAYDVRSPMDGIVIARHINKGEFVENGTMIYEIADLSTIWIEIGIYPKDLVFVKEGQMVDISLPFDEKSAQAKIIYLSPIIQDETITTKAVAELKNPNGNWRPGSFVKVDIATENAIAPIVVSKEAIQEIDGKEFIFIYVPEGFEKSEVKIGLRDNENVEILSGLKAGEKYAASNTFLLKADLGKKEAEHEH